MRQPTLNPAFWSLYAVKSRKLTNWLKTMLLVVASWALRLQSSSSNASIFEDERQVSRLRRPSMPWRALGRFSSSSRAGASRSIVNGRWQTGQAGYCISCISYCCQHHLTTPTYIVFDCGVEILLDTFSIKDVPAFRLDGVFCDVVADSTDRSFTNLNFGKG